MDLNYSILSVFVTTLILSVCYVLGRNEASIVWILILATMNFVKSYIWKKKEKRLMALRQAALKEREVITAQLQDLPAWVQFPDIERVEWINKVILQLWPYIAEYSKQFLREFIEPQIKSQMPFKFRSFKFTKMDIGDIPCRVGGIKVYTHNVGRDRIIVDMDVAYAGDAEFDVCVAGFTGGLKELQFSGKVRATLKPLLPYPPMVGGVSATFLEPPNFDFNLTGIGEFVEVPGLMDAIRAIINSQVAAICVLPNEVVVPLAPNVDVSKLYFPEPDGAIRLRVIEAKNLENKDISFIKKGKSDPYCEIQVGSQFFKTKTITDELNPVWNECFEAIVDQADGQKLRIELFDEDIAGADDELGRFSINMSTLRKVGSIDQWYPLEGCKSGDIHLTAEWLNLSSSLNDLKKQNWNNQWLQSKNALHCSTLMVFIDNVSNLPYPRSKLEPSPFVEVSLSKEVLRTPVKVKTINPLYQSRFKFFVQNPEAEELKVEAIDDGTKKSLGAVKIPLQSIINEPKLEYVQQTFFLTLGVHQSPMVLTARIRAFVPCGDDGSVLSKHFNSGADDEERYSCANAVHIERASQSSQNGTPKNGGNFQKLPSLMRGKLTRTISNVSTRSGRSLVSRMVGKSRANGYHNSWRLQFSLRYVQDAGTLILTVHSAAEQRSGGVDRSANTYVCVKLIANDNIVVQKRRTDIFERTSEPLFNTAFQFNVSMSGAPNYTLLIAIKDANGHILHKKRVLGLLRIRLKDYDLSTGISTRWVDLEFPPK